MVKFPSFSSSFSSKSSKASEASKASNSATTNDDTLPSTRPWLFIAADVDYNITNGSNEMINGEGSADMNDEGISIIDKSTEDSDTENDDNQKPKKRNEKRKKNEKSDPQQYPPRHSQTLVNDAKNTDKNKVDSHKEAKGFERMWKRTGWFSRFGGKEKEKAKEGETKTSPSHSASSDVGLEEADDKGFDDHERGAHKNSKLVNNLKDIKSTGEKQNEAIGEQQCPFPKFSLKDIDEDNLQTDDEGDENGGSWFNKPLFTAKNKAVNQDKPEIFENFDPTASGNAMTKNVSKVRENKTLNPENNMRGGATLLREERRGIRLMERKKAASDSDVMGRPRIWNGEYTTDNDHRMSINAPSVSCKAQTSGVSGGIIDPDPSFHTRTFPSDERDGEIIRARSVSDTVTIIEEMYKATSKDSKPRKKPIYQKAFSLPVALKRKWSGSPSEADMKKDNKASGVTQNESAKKTTKNPWTSLLQSRHKAKHLKKDAEEMTHLQEMMQHGNNNNSTGDLERQVKEITRTISAVHTSFISKSNSVKSVVPIIESDSTKARESADGPQKTARFHPRYRQALKPIYEPEPAPISSTEETLHSRSEPFQLLERSCEPTLSHIPSIQETLHPQSDPHQLLERYCEPTLPHIPSMQETLHPLRDPHQIPECVYEPKFFPIQMKAHKGLRRSTERWSAGNLQQCFIKDGIKTFSDSQMCNNEQIDRNTEELKGILILKKEHPWIQEAEGSTAWTRYSEPDHTCSAKEKGKSVNRISFADGTIFEEEKAEKRREKKGKMRMVDEDSVGTEDLFRVQSMGI